MYDRAFARRVNDHVHGITALPMPTNLRIRLVTAMGDVVTYGTEAGSGGGYVSGSGAPLAGYAASTDATPTACLLSAGIMVANWPRTETLVGMELWGDVAGVPTRLELGAFGVPLDVAAGDNVLLDATDIASTLGS
jgi:hypothetical protein